MIHLLRSELVKITSTKMWWIMFVVGAALTALGTASLLWASGMTDPSTGEPLPGVPALSDPGAMRNLLATMGSAQVVALILGILGFTAEYRHGTITDTFLTEPRRGLLITAKALAYALTGVLLAVVTSAVSLALILVMLPSREHAAIEANDVLLVFAAVVLTYVLYAILGVALGALVTNQIAAIVIAVLWVLLIESLIVTIWPDVGKWLPGGAASGVMNMQATSVTGVGTDLLPLPLAVAVLLGYAVVFSAAAALTTLRRDIT